MKYIVTNGVISTDKQYTYLEDAQQELAEVLEDIEEITRHEHESDVRG
jgi:predicted transcriptional regulator